MDWKCRLWIREFGERYFSHRLQPGDKALRKCDQISIEVMTYYNDYRTFIVAPHKICNLTEKVYSVVTNSSAIVNGDNDSEN